MLVAEARLHEAGYRGRTLFVIEEEEEETSTKIDDEVSRGHVRRTYYMDVE